jgi:hypothetical protein
VRAKGWLKRHTRRWRAPPRMRRRPSPRPRSCLQRLPGPVPPPWAHLQRGDELHVGVLAAPLALGRRAVCGGRGGDCGRGGGGGDCGRDASAPAAAAAAAAVPGGLGPSRLGAVLLHALSRSRAPWLAGRVVGGLVGGPRREEGLSVRRGAAQMKRTNHRDGGRGRRTRATAVIRPAGAVGSHPEGSPPRPSAACPLPDPPPSQAAHPHISVGQGAAGAAAPPHVTAVTAGVNGPGAHSRPQARTAERARSRRLNPLLRSWAGGRQAFQCFAKMTTAVQGEGGMPGRAPAQRTAARRPPSGLAGGGDDRAGTARGRSAMPKAAAAAAAAVAGCGARAYRRLRRRAGGRSPGRRRTLACEGVRKAGGVERARGPAGGGVLRGRAWGSGRSLWRGTCAAAGGLTSGAAAAGRHAGAAGCTVRQRARALQAPLDASAAGCVRCVSKAAGRRSTRRAAPGYGIRWWCLLPIWQW